MLGIATLGASTLAGCLGSISGSSRESIEPEPVDDDPEGTPGEMYTLLERNDIVVDEMFREDDELTLKYDSTATDVEESEDEIGVIVTVFNELIVEDETDFEICYGIVEPGFEAQAHGWGVKTEWLENYNAGTLEESTLWHYILNSRVYEEDI